MATLSALRELLRTELSDLIRLSKDKKRFENEQLEAALFDSLRQHNRQLTWDTLPPEEEQLIRILAKSHLSRDKALEYALDPKMQVGSAIGRDKVPNADMLLRISQSLFNEYIQTRDMIASANSDSGDVIVGTLVRTSRSIRAQVPIQAASLPSKPVIYSATYEYDATAGTGNIRLKWQHPTDYDLAYVRVYAERGTVTSSSEIIKTFYDLPSVFSAAIPYATPLVATYSNPQLQQGEALIEKTLTPTGTWHLMLQAVNWNSLFSFSDPCELTVEHSIVLHADAYYIGAA